MLLFAPISRVVLTPRRCYVWPCLIEFSGVALTESFHASSLGYFSGFIARKTGRFVQPIVQIKAGDSSVVRASGS